MAGQVGVDEAGVRRGVAARPPDGVGMPGSTDRYLL